MRNTVGFDWDPATKELWFTDNGRDWMGDDVAARRAEPRARRGHALRLSRTATAATIKRPRVRQGAALRGLHAARAEPRPARRGARHALLHRARSFPPTYRDRIFIAEHGSWNRSTKIGYRVSLVRLENGKAISYEPFATGWLQGTDVWGRPVDVLVMPDGSLLVSDDLAGAIYRITYRN